MHDDKLFFEFIVLESFQAGLSWHTILKNRENFRAAFDGFDVQKIADYDANKVEQLLSDSGIIRNRFKVLAAITNANAFIKIQEEFGTFSNYIWQFTGGKPMINHPKTSADVPAAKKLSDQISKDLKKRGFKFMGSTVVYAFLQATGIINDHFESCSFK